MSKNEFVKLLSLVLIGGVLLVVWLFFDNKEREKMIMTLRSDLRGWFGLNEKLIACLTYLDQKNRKLMKWLHRNNQSSSEVAIAAAVPSIIVPCEFCGQKLRLPNAPARRKVTCASCSYSFIYEPEVIGSSGAKASHLNQESEADAAITFPSSSSTRRLAIISAFAGAGFALIILLAVGALRWYNQPPQHPITAEFKEIRTSERGDVVTLVYILHNHTKENFVFDRLLLAIRSRGNSLIKEGSLAPFVYDTKDKDNDAMMFVPLALPAGDEVTFFCELKNGVGGIDGLTLLDGNGRIKIDLPKGW